MRRGEIWDGGVVDEGGGWEVHCEDDGGGREKSLAFAEGSDRVVVGVGVRSARRDGVLCCDVVRLRLKRGI